MNKYSTEEMVNELLTTRVILLILKSLPRPDIWNAIIAKLRAADNLCEAAKKVQKYFQDDYVLNILDKAIADYEGKEKE